MKLISEEAHDIEFLTEASKDGSKNYFIEGVFMQAETKNRNGRIYPKDKRHSFHASLSQLCQKTEGFRCWSFRVAFISARADDSF